MNRTLNRTIGALAVSAAITLLSACGGSSGSGISGGTDSSAGNAIVVNDFSFPEIGEANDSITIPSGPAPAFSARRVLSSGSGNVIEFGDPVVLNYKMFSWSTGELVESSDNRLEPMTIRAGVTEGVPDYMSKSLLGRKVGDQLQLVFKSGMEDLPDYFDSSDAYVVVVDII